MIPIPAVWDATGNWSQLDTCVNFWSNPAMVAVLKKHEAYTLLNIANEAGDGSVSDAQYRAGYTAAIQELRAAGLKMPLVIDAANWGRNEDYILDNAGELLQIDPNLIFSWHPYDPGQPASRYQAAFDGAAQKGIALIVGEFAQLEFPDQPNTVIDYTAIMQKAQASGVGWLWWWWYGSDGHSLTSDGKFGNWANRGEEVCVTSNYGIQKTSQRPAPGCL
jgi:mannan endo-1,4-beta-mannosidase